MRPSSAKGKAFHADGRVISHEMLNRNSHVEADSLDSVPAIPVGAQLNDVVHIEEVRKAVTQMKCNKASGGNGINAEL